MSGVISSDAARSDWEDDTDDGNATVGTFTPSSA
jgi:hypothetical protein